MIHREPMCSACTLIQDYHFMFFVIQAQGNLFLKTSMHTLFFPIYAYNIVSFELRLLNKITYWYKIWRSDSLAIPNPNQRGAVLRLCVHWNSSLGLSVMYLWLWKITTGPASHMNPTHFVQSPKLILSCTKWSGYWAPGSKCTHFSTGA